MHGWHTTHLCSNWNNNKKFIYHLKMPCECQNGNKLINYFSNLLIDFFFNLKFFLSLCLIAKKMEENNLWQHHWSLVTCTSTYTTHDLQDPQVQNENSTARNKPRLKPTSHQHIFVDPKPTEEPICWEELGQIRTILASNSSD